MSLLDLQPHKVSRNLRGYSVFFYGQPKSGKTTIASKFPKALILAFEKGYNALPGVFAQPINSWGEFKKLFSELKTPEVHEKFETIVIDTADIAYSYCEKFICNREGVDSIGDIPYGKGYALISQEFDESIRKILNLDYFLLPLLHHQVLINNQTALLSAYLLEPVYILITSLLSFYYNNLIKNQIKYFLFLLLSYSSIFSAFTAIPET